MTTTRTPAVDGWFTDGPEPALLASRCTTCGDLVFPPSTAGFCRNPGCGGEDVEPAPLSRRGTVWSYTDAQYQPPAPYLAPAVAAAAAEEQEAAYRPFALAAVELPEGIVVLGQVADGFGVDDLRVGAEVELVVETLYVDRDVDRDADVERTVWRWRPVR